MNEKPKTYSNTFEDSKSSRTTAPEVNQSNQRTGYTSSVEAPEEPKKSAEADENKNMG